MREAKADSIDYIETASTTFEIHSFYNGGLTLDELIKNALRRDAERAVLLCGKE
jgi:hypothetical protein